MDVRTDDRKDASLSAWSLFNTSQTPFGVCATLVSCSFFRRFLDFSTQSDAVVTQGSTHLTVEEAESNFGAVNHASVILHIDAALLPATGRIVGRIPLYVVYCLQIFMRHFLQEGDYVGLWWSTEIINQLGLL